MIGLILKILLAVAVLYISLTLLSAVLIAWAGSQVVESVEAAIPSDRERDSWSSSKSNPPPILSVAKAVRLRMPTTYPFRRVEHAWPPFQGVRVELGGDRDV